MRAMLEVCLALALTPIPIPNSNYSRACSPHFISIRSKIKCLAEQPACSSCVKRKLKCTYDTRLRQDSASPLSNEGDGDPSMIDNGVPAAPQEDLLFDALLPSTSGHRSTHLTVSDVATSAGSATEHPKPFTENFSEGFPDLFADHADLFGMPGPDDFDYNQDWLFGQPSGNDWSSFPV